MLMSVKEDISQISVSNFQYLGQGRAIKLVPFFIKFFLVWQSIFFYYKISGGLVVERRHRTLDLKVGV